MRIKNKLLLLILTLALIPAIAITLVFHFTAIETLEEQMKMTKQAMEAQIKEVHYKGVRAVDTLIWAVVSDMANIAFTAGPKVADFIENQDYESLKEKLIQIDEMPEKTGRGIGCHIVIATDKQGNILARSDVATIAGEKAKTGVAQYGHIIEDWIGAPQGFKDGFEKAKQGYADARKIIYDAYFAKREGYRHLIEEYGFEELMGLTTQTPIFNLEQEQVGILFIITILNNNQVAISAITAITGVEFTAISPTGEIMASFFVTPPERTPAIIEKVEYRAKQMLREEKEKTGKDTITYTIERIYLRPCPGKVVFRNGAGYCYVNGEIIPEQELEERPYRFHFITEVDPNLYHVAMRGVAYDLTHFDELITVQEAYFYELMGAQTKYSGIALLITFLFIGGLSLIIENKGASPILKFAKKIKQIEKGDLKQRIDIKTGDEIEALARAFNNMLGKINESYEEIEEQKGILEVRVNARTQELKELTESLDEQVKEKTKKIQEKMTEMKKFHDLTVGRELKMIELKKQIQALEKRLEENRK